MADPTGESNRPGIRGMSVNISGDAQPSLIFEPTTGLTGTSAEAVAPQMNAQASVRFESARLVSTP